MQKSRQKHTHEQTQEQEQEQKQKQKQKQLYDSEIAIGGYVTLKYPVRGLS